MHVHVCICAHMYVCMYGNPSVSPDTPPPTCTTPLEAEEAQILKML